MKSLLLALALAATIPGCASLDTPTKKIEAACLGSATAIKVLTAANDAGKLSADQQASVRKALDIIQPVCTAASPPSLDAIKQAAFADAIARLEAYAQGVKP